MSKSTEKDAKRILLVGHCGFDGPRLEKELSRRFPGAQVMRINSEDDLARECEAGADLLLINREPVGFDTDGMELVRRQCKSGVRHKVMLVSDYPEAQEEAMSAGAVRGFGKGEIGQESLTRTVRDAIER
jgi:hypothetical protein